MLGALRFLVGHLGEVGCSGHSVSGTSREVLCDFKCLLLGWALVLIVLAVTLLGPCLLLVSIAIASYITLHLGFTDSIVMNQGFLKPTGLPHLIIEVGM